ncbi:hypothetical protein [Actinospica robiniae]|uniref:hypothetical protein n=1 Tax=Actinospica robiniae TaxID=304901 RepID=UPI0004059D1A|nr:hypothetical protein [Actinospica robiniae]
MTPAFKVSVVGPSRVGKTSLLTAVFADTELKLAGTSLEVVLDEVTERRVNKHNKELRSAIEAKEFSAAALAGTNTIENYQIALRSVDDPDLVVPFDLQDYPGGWLDPQNRAANNVAPERWRQCESHIRGSIMLLIPIDAAVLMEARTPSQRAAALNLLGIVDVEKVVRMWVRSRNLEENCDEPAVLMFVPLKCEKYFDPHRPADSDAAALTARVKEAYGTVTEIVRKEATQRSVRVVYNPVDTYGCVELYEGLWKQAGDAAAGQLDFTGYYHFRGNPPTVQVRAAGVVMQELCRCVLAGQENLERLAQAAHQEDHDRLAARRAEAKGFWGTITFYISGEAGENAAGMQGARSAIGTAQRRRYRMHSDIARLAQLADDARTQDWTGR